MKTTHFKTSHLKILSFFCLALISFSCSKNSGNNNSNSCTVTYTESAALTSDQQIEYLAGVENGATISSLSFLDSAGTTTIQNPTLPFARFINLKSGVKPTITATGNSPSTGHVIISAFVGGVQSGTSCP